jgi:hypothetical protein
MSLYDDMTGLVSHNRLSSQSAILASEIGANYIEAGTTLYTDGYYSGGVKGSTGGNQIDLQIQNILANSNEGACSFWCRPDSGYTTASQIFLFSTQTASQAQIQIEISSGNMRARIGVWGGSVVNLTYSLTNFTQGVWSNVGLVWKAAGIGGGSDTIRFYHNGAQVAQTTTVYTTAAFTSGTNSSIAGRSGQPTNYPRWSFSNFKIWNIEKTNFSNYQHEWFGGKEG